MKKVKVMYFIHGLNTGGAETLVKNYAVNLDKSKFDVTILCLEHIRQSPYEAFLSANNIKVKYVEDYLFFKSKVNIFVGIANHFFRYLIVRKILHQEAPDVLHTHLAINSFVKFARPRGGTVLFYTVHSDPKVLWDIKKRDKRKDFKATRWLVKKYGMEIIALHEEMKDEINNMFGISDVIVLNNGIDVAALNKKMDGVKKKKDEGIPDGSFVVGHIGRFSAVKNHDFLIDVFKKIAEKNKNVFLLMIGDGPGKESVKKKIDEYGLKDRCKILSNRNDVSELLGVMDIFVFPSLYEGLPLSLIEAQIAGKPCFISDSINEYADISNLVVRMSLKQSPKEWADVILSYKKPERIVVNVDDWDIKKITKDLERIYIEAFSENKNGSK